MLGRRSKSESEIKKPAEKAQTPPMCFWYFLTNIPAERVAPNAVIADRNIGKVSM